MSCHITSYHVMSCYVISCSITSCHVISHHIMLCHVMPYHIMSCHVMSCHVMSCHITSYHVMSCYVISFIITSCHIISYHVWNFTNRLQMKGRADTYWSAKTLTTTTTYVHESFRGWIVRPWIPEAPCTHPIFCGKIFTFVNQLLVLMFAAAF